MRKRTLSTTAAEQRWVLEGRLTQPWSAARERPWRKMHGARQGRPAALTV